MDYARVFKKISNNFDVDEVDQFAKAYQVFQLDMKAKLLPPGMDIHCDLKSGAQSKEFMRHLLDEIQGYFRTFPYGTRFSVLDVGPGTSEGSNLLGSLYRSRKLGYGAKVETIDIRPDYVAYAKVFAPHTKALVGDVFDLSRSYDVVIASHVIEHVQKPIDFCRQLQKISKGIVLICAPLMEDRDMITSGHINVFDQGFLDELGGDIRTIQSAGWGQFVEPPYEMFIAQLPGLAQQRHD